jgi:hypothetical protein
MDGIAGKEEIVPWGRFEGNHLREQMSRNGVIFRLSIMSYRTERRDDPVSNQ